MYDVIVIGQGLSGLISAIWAKDQGYRTALASIGTGKIIQSSGVLDSIPGIEETYPPAAAQKAAIEQFKEMTKKIGYPYKGDIENPIPIVTGAGHVKKTVLYPATISPIPVQGRVVIVGFDDVIDFQPAFIRGNLMKSRPQLIVDTMSVGLGKHSQRTMTQLDAARLLDLSEVRSDCIGQIKQKMVDKRIGKPDLFIFPASLGMENWKTTLEEFSRELDSAITEAPGMPPNATAIRIYERLKREAVRLGVRFYENSSVSGCQLDGANIDSVIIHNGNQIKELRGKQFILATGGILGGGLEKTSNGLKETALGLETNEQGEIQFCPSNLYPLGASKGLKVTRYGITGGVYSILCAHEAITDLSKKSIMGGTRSA